MALCSQIQDFGKYCGYRIGNERQVHESGLGLLFYDVPAEPMVVQHLQRSGQSARGLPMSQRFKGKGLLVARL